MLVTPCLLLRASHSVLVTPCLLLHGLAVTRIRLCLLLCRQISAKRLRVLAKFSCSHCSYQVSLMRSEYTRSILWLQMFRICEIIASLANPATESLSLPQPGIEPVKPYALTQFRKRSVCAFVSEVSPFWATRSSYNLPALNLLYLVNI